jgi:hypothetical protein
VRLAVAVLTGRSGPEWRIPVATGSISRFDVRREAIEVVPTQMEPPKETVRL